jgi:hypothetical protein
MKSLLLLWQKAAEELAARCRTSTTKDFETVLGRFEHEGLSFLTITLPSFGEDLQKGLDQGFVDRNLFQGFSWKGGLPRFLGGFLDLVFDRGTGRLVDEPSVDAIQAMRQLTLMFGKILIPCSDARIERAIRRYIDCEKEVRDGDRERTPDDIREFTRMSNLLWSGVLSSVDQMVHGGNLLPRHGPGATADRIRGNAKFIQREWPERLERIFPYGEYALPNWRYYEYLNRVDFLEPGRERPVRVITVPKTLKTPRIIAIEPVAMQYMQQAISRSLVDAIESGDSQLGWLLGFSDQRPNQSLAAEGSYSGSLATLDLREASDRVSNQLVRAMLENHPWLGEAVDASRSRKADVPGYGVVRLAKFASMGSALTFPIEAMVFATIIFLGIQEALNRPLTKKDIQSFKGQVRVYGDDIICPVEFVHSVVGKLEAFGFRVNHDKSFWNGKFRESCGKEYYDGEDVSIVRVRRVFPTQPTDVLDTISLVSLRNRFYMGGMWMTARYLDDVLERLLKRFPTVMPGAPVLGRWSLLDYQIDKYHPTLHAPLVKGYVVKAKLPVSELDDVWALQKVFLSKAGLEKTPYQELTDFILGIGGEPASDKEHLRRQGRPDAVDIKLRWTSPISIGDSGDL